MLILDWEVLYDLTGDLLDLSNDWTCWILITVTWDLL